MNIELALIILIPPLGILIPLAIPILIICCMAYYSDVNPRC